MTIAEKLAYLAGENETDTEGLLAQAIALGVNQLFQEAVATSYIEGRCTRDKAIAALGERAVREIDLSSRSEPIGARYRLFECGSRRLEVDDEAGRAAVS